MDNELQKRKLWGNEFQQSIALLKKENITVLFPFAGLTNLGLELRVEASGS